MVPPPDWADVVTGGAAASVAIRKPAADDNQTFFMIDSMTGK
jgi:hypothetical protein